MVRLFWYARWCAGMVNRILTGRLAEERFFKAFDFPDDFDNIGDLRWVDWALEISGDGEAGIPAKAIPALNFPISKSGECCNRDIMARYRGTGVGSLQVSDARKLYGADLQIPGTWGRGMAGCERDHSLRLLTTAFRRSAALVCLPLMPREMLGSHFDAALGADRASWARRANHDIFTTGKQRAQDVELGILVRS